MSAPEGAGGHHRLVLAIETSAAAVDYYSHFQDHILSYITTHLVQQPSFEAAVVVFGPLNGTARSCVSTSPWTNDVSVLQGWMAAVPAMLEGTGTVAAFEAISEALCMLRVPSMLTPADGPDSPAKCELFMLWVSEGAPLQDLLFRPANHPPTPWQHLPQLLFQPPHTALLVLMPHNLGARTTVQKLEQEGLWGSGTKERALHQSALYSIVPCMSLWFVDALRSGVLLAVMTELQRKAASNAMHQERVRACIPHSATLRHAQAKQGAQADDNRSQPGQRPSPAGVIESPVWTGTLSTIAVQTGARQVVAEGVHMRIAQAGAVQLPSLAAWPANLDVVMALPFESVVSMLKLAPKSSYYRLVVDLNAAGKASLFPSGRGACFLSWPEAGCMAVVLQDKGKVYGVYIAESTVQKHMPVA